MRSPRTTCLVPATITDLDHIVTASDDKARVLLEWWRRMHRRPNALVAIAVKAVMWSADGATAARFVWEVCQWPQGDAAKWTFICWMLDGEGMWLKEFPSKQAAMDYYGLPPAVVMAGGTNVRDVAQRRRAS